MTLHLEPTPRDRLRGTVCDIIELVSKSEIDPADHRSLKMLGGAGLLRVAELIEEEFAISLGMASLLDIAMAGPMLGDLLDIIEEAQNARGQ